MTHNALALKIAQVIADRQGVGPGRLRAILGVSGREVSQAVGIALQLGLIEEMDPGPRGGTRYQLGEGTKGWRCSGCGLVHICEPRAAPLPIQSRPVR